MKKILIIVCAVIVLIVGGLILVPVIFKDEIKAAVNDGINKQLNAKAYFGDFGLSVFSHFPNVTVQLDQFGVVGIDDFEGDTLANVRQFNLVIDIMSVITGDEMKVSKLILDEPRIHAIVLKDGTANWDIMKPDTTAPKTPEPESDTATKPLKLQLNEYAINHAFVTYDDHQGNMHARLVNFTHSGAGNFDDQVFAFDTRTTCDELTFSMDGTDYLRNASLDFDIEMEIDNANSHYTLKKNTFRINELVLGLDGTVEMPGDDIIMDMQFNSRETTFRSLLSMVPGMYTADFKEIQTDGTFALDGYAKGIYNEQTLPAFGLNLLVQNAWFQYPDLPGKVSNIDIDVKVNCPDGKLNSLSINMQKGHLEFGSNPVDMKLALNGVMSGDYNVDADVKAVLDLAQLGTMFPIEGQEIKGTFTMGVKANGTYSEAKSSFPKVDATMKLENGFYKTADFPSAIDNMTLDAVMNNTNGSLSETYLKLSAFHAEIDGEPLDVTGEVKDFEDITYDLAIKGSVDLAKLNKIYPLENTEMAGKIVADMKTSGKMSLVDAEKYTELPTSGTMQITGLFYKDADLEQGMKIDNAEMSFNNKDLVITTCTGMLGKSDFTVSGAINNYLRYALLENEPLTGNMKFYSKKFDCNEWMTEEEEEEKTGTAPVEGGTTEEELSVYEVPKGIDFVLDSKIDEVLFDNLDLKNMVGKVVIENQEVRFENCSFQTLGGTMTMAGSYNTKDISKPAFAFTLGIDKLDIATSFEKFNSIQMLAPVAKFAEGVFNTKMELNGLLGQDMMPDLGTLSAKGILEVLNAKLSGCKIVDAINNKTQLLGDGSMKEFGLSKFMTKFHLDEGKLHVDPFDVPVGKSKMNVSGYNRLDGQMDYDLKFSIPAGALGSTAVNSLSGLTGTTVNPDQKMDITLKLGGTIDDPKIGGANSNFMDDVKDQIKDAVEDKINDAKDSVKNMVNDKIDDTKQQLEDEMKKKEEEAKKKLEEEKQKLDAEKKKQEEEAKKKLEEEKKKQEEEAKKKMEEEKNKLKDKLKWPK